MDILVVVSEALAEEGKAACRGGVFGYLESEAEHAPAVQRELVDGDLGELPAVDEGAVPVDDQGFQKAVLIPGGQPPSGREETMDVAEISGAGPGAHESVVEKEADIRGPVIVGPGSL